MKATYILLFMLMCLAGFCQETKVIHDPIPERYKLYYYAPITFGNNMLAKAHTNNFNGFGLSITMFRIAQAHVNLTAEHNTFSVSDVSMAGNSETTMLTNFMIEGMYKFPLTEQMAVNPKVAIGAARISQSGNGQFYGTQYGVSYNMGGEFDYKVIGRLRAFAGIGYSYMRMRVNTAPELENFYNNVHLLNLSIGVKF